jgi:hypothetical protein
MPHDTTPKQRWLEQVIGLCPEGSRSDAREYLQPLLHRCNSKSRKTFVQWARLTLAKNPETSRYLDWVRESKLPPEVVAPHQRAGFHYVINGGIALIEIIDGSDRALWKVPVDKLDWALSQSPAFLRKLPPLEPQEAMQRRRLETRLRRKDLSTAQRQEIEFQIAKLRADEQRTFAPVPRFMLLKYSEGSQLLVHHLFLKTGPGDIVESVNGDFLDFTTVTLRVTSKVVTEAGLGVRKGNRPVEETEEITLPNLYLVASDVSQRNFEQSMLQIKINQQGDIDQSPLRVLPNATWDAGFYGKVEDAGESEPLTSADAVPSDFEIAEPVGTENSGLTK